MHYSSMLRQSIASVDRTATLVSVGGRADLNLRLQSCVGTPYSDVKSGSLQVYGKEENAVTLITPKVHVGRVLVVLTKMTAASPAIFPA